MNASLFCTGLGFHFLGGFLFGIRLYVSVILSLTRHQKGCHDAFPREASLFAWLPDIDQDSVYQADVEGAGGT